MKKVMLIILIAFASNTTVNAQNKAIQKVILKFVQAGDQNNVEILESCLDDNFRIVMNQLFGKTDVQLLPKTIYLSKIKSKEFGGDKRKVTFEKIVSNETSACVKVKITGTKMTMVSLITLIKNHKGLWKLISDIPIIKQ